MAVHGVTFRYNAATILDGATFEAGSGDFLAIIGPNGSGKSTLLRCMSRTLKPLRGSILLDERDLQSLAPVEVAKRLAVVPQDSEFGLEFSVEEAVLMGRQPHLARFQPEGPRDWEAAHAAMARTGILHLSERSISRLSGGEKQRAMIARALAQEPDVLLLDEPTSHLDLKYQVEILDLLAHLNRDKGLTVIAAIHDLNLAAQYFHRFILLSEGKILALGGVEEVLTPVNLKRAFGDRVTLSRHPVYQYPLITASPAPGEECSTDAGGGRGKLVFVTGGARSGKSVFAERYARQSGKRVIYVATAEAYDGEMARRIEEHRRRRPAGWTTVEEPLWLAPVIRRDGDAGTLLLVDCLTMLISNHLLARAGTGGEELGSPARQAEIFGKIMAYLQETAVATRDSRADVVVVSNEVGMGLVPETPLGRLYRDLVGKANQEFAALADEAFVLFSGLPFKLR